MKLGSTAITIMALLLVLLLVASPAFGGEPKGGSGEQTQARAGAAQGNGDTSPDTTECDGDMTRDRTQDRTQDQTCDAACDGDGTQTQTRSQARTKAAAGAGSEDATQTQTRTRSQFMLESGAASGTVDTESEEPVIEEAKTAAQAGDLLGDVLHTMTRLTERLFTWLGIA